MLDRITQNFTQLGFDEDQRVQRMILELAATYTRYTISQPDWVLPWLSSLGGAFTGLVIVLSTLKRILFPLLHWGPCHRLMGRCCSRVGKSCLHNEVESVVQRQWRTTHAMEQAE